MEDANSSIYALKTSAGQERNVARLLAHKAISVEGIGISAILVPESLKGYILVESSTKIDLRNPDLKVPHLRGVVEGKHGITFEEGDFKFYVNSTNLKETLNQSPEGLDAWTLQEKDIVTIKK